MSPVARLKGRSASFGAHERRAVHSLPTHDMRRTSGFIDLHQDMLLGVSRTDGGFPVYGSSYLTGPLQAAAIWSSMFPHEPESSLIGQLGEHDELLRSFSSSLRLITTVEDLDADDLRTGVLPHSEGFHLPAIDAGSLASLWSEHSLRSLSLTWNHETAYGFSCYDDNRSPLKPTGRQLVRTLEGTPLFLDLSHLNDAGFYEVLDLYSRPVLVTHSPCRAIVDHPRGLSDEQLRALGDHGGLVGQAFCPDFLGERGSVDEALRHIDRVASLAGENAVSIGSDWGTAAMGELRDTETLGGLVSAVSSSWGPDLAAKFAFTNAHDFLRRWLPTRSC
jgi:microsomal dipeptidase-like Zn-dependent dipeptidase